MLRSALRRVAPVALLFSVLFLQANEVHASPDPDLPAEPVLLPTEKLAGKGLWIDPAFETAFERAQRIRATVWFEDQFLGDGTAYTRRAKEFAKAKRTEMRAAMIRTLKATADRSWKAAEKELDVLLKNEGIRAVDRFWIVNGFSCGVTRKGIEGLKKVPGVRKVFVDTSWRRIGPARTGRAETFAPRTGETGDTKGKAFDPARYKRPWYVRYLLADRVWKDLGVTGKGTLNVIHDHNFIFSPNTVPNVHRNAGEIPGNGKDDDGNGLIDDYHGFNFNWNSPVLTTQPVPPRGGTGAQLHGFMCGAIICGTGAPGHEYEFGIAPEGRWAGVISGRRMEAAVQWAIEQAADTYSMSFSSAGKGEHRSHWRKLMEHGSFCGVFFVSGAGNFGVSEKVPVQMRQPEDIPNAVFAAAGVQRDLSRTRTSSKGPVLWDTEHYKDGEVQKPAVCAFNFDLPWLFRDGAVRNGGLGGNSFAGPMFCGSIALMVSADPDLLPWDLRDIITSTAMDVAAPGVDFETGHGLINCYRAVKEVLRRKAVREGKDPKPFTGRTKGDELDVASLKDRLKVVAVTIAFVAPKGQAKDLGIQAGDVITSYDGVEIKTLAQFREQLKAMRDAKKTDVPLVLRRGDKAIEVKLKPGRIGIRSAQEYSEPVFE